MPQDAKDIQFAELKDMIAQLNTTIAASDWNHSGKGCGNCKTHGGSVLSAKETFWRIF